MAPGCTTTDTVSLALRLNVLFGWRAALFDLDRQLHLAVRWHGESVDLVQAFLAAASEREDTFAVGADVDDAVVEPSEAVALLARQPSPE